MSMDGAFREIFCCYDFVETQQIKGISTLFEHPGATSQSDLPRSLPARATSSSRSHFDGVRHEETSRDRPLRATYQGRSQPERPAQSDYLKSLQPERPAQVARILTGRDTKKRVGSDLLERLC
ncbi:hypothetical protein F2Q69_00028712 [Brassica cretica]|uniref:Uncharacterized protein n=1 Tax=Brassica cretica TaxID=69181 RepID=A0A8S9S9M3_BRACR|nr:hypothetical protein F2Q69_00028712 [Brassica cretica]